MALNLVLNLWRLYRLFDPLWSMFRGAGSLGWEIDLAHRN